MSTQIGAAVTDLPHFALFQPDSASILSCANKTGKERAMIRHDADGPGLFRRLVLYILLLIASLVAGLGVWGGLQAKAATVETMVADSLAQVASVAAGATLDMALADACATTGCDPADLHHVIAAGAAAMATHELAEEIRAQERIAGTGGPDALTAARLAEFYRAERARR